MDDDPPSYGMAMDEVDSPALGLIELSPPSYYYSSPPSLLKDICQKTWLPQEVFVYLQGKTGASPSINKK